MDLETIAGLVAFFALVIVWIGAPAGVSQAETAASTSPATA
jgi:hypothetical protein